MFAIERHGAGWGVLRYAWAVSLTREEVLLELIDEHDVAVLRSTWE